MSGARFAELFSRADEETLATIVGRPVVRLLGLLDAELTRPSKLREIAADLASPEAMLRDGVSRRLLLSLLRRDQAIELAGQLGFEVENPYESLLTMDIRKGSSREHILFASLGVVSGETPSSGPLVSVANSEPDYGLFPHQRRAYREVLDVLTGTGRRVVLHMPTGSGKTRTAMHVISTFLRRDEPTVVCWLAFSEELCEQAVTEFEEAWTYLGDRNLDVFRFWGGGRALDIDEIRDGFLVAGLAKTYQRARSDGDFLSRLADRVGLVVVDEAHQAIADTYSFVLDFLVDRNDRSRLLGLTATPGRTWDEPDEDERLSNFFDRKKVTLEVEGYDNPVEFLIDNGYLARPEFKSLGYSPTESLNSDQLSRLAGSLDIPDSVLKHLAEDERRNLLIVSAVEDLIRRGHQRILVFAATVEHAVMLATILRARGFDAAAVTAQTPSYERARLITRFKNADPEPRVLMNFGVLTTGFDAPRTSAAVIARPTRSLVLYSQMVGRATRGTRAGGNESAEVLTIADTHLPGFGDLSEAFGNWEDVWDDE